MANNESASHDNWTRSADYWKQLESSFAEVIKAQNRAIRDRMEGEDAGMRYHDTLAIIEEWLQREFSPEVIWLGLEQVILETSAAEDEPCLEVAIDAGHSFLRSANWINSPGPWNKMGAWIVGLKLPPHSVAKFAQMVGHYVVVDCETSGLSVDDDRIIRLNWAKFAHGRLISEASTLVNPLKPIEAEVEGFTGISNMDLHAAPAFDDAATGLMAIVNENIVVAHNAEFSVGFLKSECARHKVPFSPYGVCCTYDLAKSTGLKGKRDLRCLAGRFGIFDEKEVVQAGKLLAALVDGE